VSVRAEAEAVGITDAGPLLQELAFGVENLDALVLAVADVDALILVDQNCVRQIELSRLIAIAAPRF
jgi:hypothetical protein